MATDVADEMERAGHVTGPAANDPAPEPPAAA